MTAALVMPDHPEHPGGGGDHHVAGTWASPKALAQLFSFHVIKDLNFLSQVIKLSVAETLQPGILTKVQMQAQSGQNDQPSLGLAVGDMDLAQEALVCENNAANVAVSQHAEEDWDSDLSQDQPLTAPTMSQISWEDNPRMNKIYKKKQEVEVARQKERQEELMQIENSALSLSQSTYDGEDCNIIASNIKPKKELDMNKVVRGGRKLFVRNINFRTTQHKLWEFFKQFGRVRTCELVKDRYTRRSRGIAFVTFDKSEECEEALSASKEELTLQGWALEVELARPRKADPKREANIDVNLSSEESSQGNESAMDKEGNLVLDDPSPPPCDILTDDAFLHVFSFLEIKHLLCCEQVCRKWRTLSSQAWKSKQSVTTKGLLPVFHSLEDQALRSMLSKCGPSLNSLDLSMSSRLLTDRSLEAIARYCPDVQDIHLSSMRITNRGFETFVKKCTKIEKIVLERCDEIREDGIWRLFNSCRDLREVCLDDCRRISGQCFHVMAGGVVSLSLNGCSKLQDVAMSKLSMRCKNLQELRINGCPLLTDGALKNLAQNEVVDTLQIFSCSKMHPRMSPEGLQHISQFVNLQELYLTENNLIRDETLQKICFTCTSLRVLDIGGCGSRITDSGLDKLPATLEHLTISYLSSVTDEGLEIISDNCGNLKSLKARYCHDITDAGVSSVIIFCALLEELDVCGCLSVTNATINTLIEEQKVRGPPQNSVRVMAGGSSIDTSELSPLPPSIDLVIIALNQPAEFIGSSFYDFESDEEEDEDMNNSFDDFDELLQNDDPFLLAEMEMS